MTRNAIGIVLNLVVCWHATAATFITTAGYGSNPNSGPSAGHIHTFVEEVEVATKIDEEINFGGLARLGDTILVGSSRAGAILQYSQDGELLSTFASFSGAIYLGDDSAGNVYVTRSSLGAPTGFRLDSSGSPTGQFVSPTSTAPVLHGIDADAAGNVYAAETSRLSKPAYLHRFSANGTVLGSTQLNYNPSDIVIDEFRQLLFVAETGLGAPIRVYSIAFGAPLLFANIPVPSDSEIYGLDYSPELNDLFAVSFGVNRTVKGFRYDLPNPVQGFPRPYLTAPIIETYYPAGAVVGRDILHIVPEPSGALLVVISVVSALLVCSRRS